MACRLGLAGGTFATTIAMSPQLPQSTLIAPSVLTVSAVLMLTPLPRTCISAASPAGVCWGISGRMPRLITAKAVHTQTENGSSSSSTGVTSAYTPYIHAKFETHVLAPTAGHRGSMGGHITPERLNLRQVPV